MYNSLHLRCIQCLPIGLPSIPVFIHLRHGSIALPMLGVSKMSVGVSLPHFTSLGNNGSHIGFFRSLTLPPQKNSTGALALTPGKKHIAI